MVESYEPKSTPAVAALAPDTILQDRYRIVRQLGRGGMGAVYEAVDQRLGITVALKETLSSEAAVRRQFEHEARLLASMQHPALPRVSDHFLEGDRAFLVMQFIGGVDLAKIIAQQPGPFPRDQVIAWADQLLDALIYLHSRDRQVIHRDIKPHNLKLTSTGQIALLDFGLAKAQPADPAVTSSAAFFGYTKQYAPLEQIQDRRTDPRSDIYALGATLYHLLTGVKPPDALLRAAALVNGESDPLKAANKIHKAVGPEISAILLKAMAQKPEDRYKNAAEFRAALRRVGRRNGSTPSSDPDDRLGENLERVGTVSLKMDMVVSKKRFGPGKATLLLVLSASLLGGGIYGAKSWYQSGKDGIASVASGFSPGQKSPVKVERARSDENASENVAQRSSNDGVVERSGEGRERLPKLALKTDGNRVAVAPSGGKSRLIVEAPRVRLPSPEFTDQSLSVPLER